MKEKQIRHLFPVFPGQRGRVTPGLPWAPIPSGRPPVGNFQVVVGEEPSRHLDRRTLQMFGLAKGVSAALILLARFIGKHINTPSTGASYRADDAYWLSPSPWRRQQDAGIHARPLNYNLTPPPR